MKRFLNILYFVSLSMLALGQSTQSDSFFFMYGGVNVIEENKREIKKDTIIVIQRDTLVEYEQLVDEGNSSQVPMLVRYTAYERRMFGVKEYSYGETQMDKRAFQRFLYENDRNVFLQHRKNQNLIQAGWWLFGGGLAMIFTGGMCHLDDEIAGFTIWPIGLVSVITSIPILCVGYANDDKIVKQFNSARSGTAITLGLTSSQNGIGLALNF